MIRIDISKTRCVYLRMTPDNGFNKKGYYAEFYEGNDVNSKLLDQKTILASQIGYGGDDDSREKRARVIAVDYAKRTLR